MTHAIGSFILNDVLMNIIKSPRMMKAICGREQNTKTRSDDLMRPEGMEISDEHYGFIARSVLFSVVFFLNKRRFGIFPIYENYGVPSL